MFRKIVLADKGSPAGDRALLYVEHLARLEEAEVIVLHAFQVPRRYSTTDSYEDLRSSFERAAWDIVEESVEDLHQAGVLARGLVREGPAAQEILRAAQEESASLIVLGTRGPDSAADFLLGSVSTEVLRFAQCPVMAVP